MRCDAMRCDANRKSEEIWCKNYSSGGIENDLEGLMPHSRFPFHTFYCNHSIAIMWQFEQSTRSRCRYLNMNLCNVHCVHEVISLNWQLDFFLHCCYVCFIRLLASWWLFTVYIKHFEGGGEEKMWVQFLWSMWNVNYWSLVLIAYWECPHFGLNFWLNMDKIIKFSQRTRKKSPLLKLILILCFPFH